jgi:hypothetical protein
MRGAKAFIAVASAVFATACSAGTARDTASAPATSSKASSVKNEVYLTELLPDGSMNFKPGEGVIGGASFAHSLVSSCEGCLPIGQSGQQNQPGMQFKVPEGFDRLEFVVGLTDSSTETDRSAGVAVYANAGNSTTKLFESSDVTVGVGIPVSVTVSPGNDIRIDGWGLNGNETLCVCDPKLVGTGTR